ncbi:Las1-domain-containing protein [Cylindrobasidium torrendii FP15055 ss-10]|uniref:Las1-domain-containing protein n=1 Tax=Cylindrobasidium torrendii FP15055 ss-10 TaxID=1314674 RepID=A0A0D7BHS2_9AGAR|nr:Las1-domain-containing protein [Cylindrobasidium torrendii FP15055 ss-10]
MQLPRRVPWSSSAELDQVCSWIFEDENDIDAKLLAIQRITAWKLITSLPHAIESTLSILTSITDDSLPRNQRAFSLTLRHNYAAALIRLVNGLVDPLQSGIYARSIASIADQLGLPLWLVELRHSATHEDLPSLELLREGARQAMVWLFNNYWLPTSNPTTVPKLEPVLRPIAPIFNEYRRLVKATVRDHSIKVSYQQPIARIVREIERWVSEAQVAIDHGLETGDAGDKESFALEKLSDELLEKGVLVPLAKKKRVFPEDGFYPPAISIQVWGPLIQQLTSTHPDLPLTLINRILSRLLSPTEEKSNSSYDACIARWAAWVVDFGQVEGGESATKRDVVASIVSTLGPTVSQAKPIALQLVQAICKGDEQLESALSLLSQTTHVSNWQSNGMDTMAQRLEELLGSSEPVEVDVDVEMEHVDKPGKPAHCSAPGWHRLDSSKWSPCPLGQLQ